MSAHDDHPNSNTQQAQGLHICVDCDSQLVQPFEWAPTDEDGWWYLMTWCPECGRRRVDTVDQPALDAYERELDEGAEALARTYERLVRENLSEDAERLAAALAVDALLPEDF